MFDSGSLPAAVRVAGLARYQRPIAAMLRRLAAERAIQRLWSRDPGLWYPAADTQARIRARLGWLDLPADARPIQRWLSALRSHDVTDLLYVGAGDPGRIARLWRDLGGFQAAPRLTVLDTIEPSEVQSTLASIPWHSSALLLAADAELAPDAEALARLALAAHSEFAPPAAPPPTLIAPPDSALHSLLQPSTQMLLLPPDLGARFGPLSALGLAPAALLGWDLQRLAASTDAMRRQCQQSADLALNPGAWLGTTLAILAQHGRDKLTLLSSPALPPLARWIAGFVAGSLSKHGRGFVTVVEEQTREQGNKGTREQREAVNDAAPVPGANDQIIVALRLAGDHNDELDRRCARLEQAGLPVVTLELADRYAIAGQLLAWQIAVATTGMVLGLNPFDEPDTAARDRFLRRRLHTGAAKALPPTTPLAESWQRLCPVIDSTGCIAIAAYLPASTAIMEHLAALQALLSRRFGVVILLLDPLRDQSFATQVLHAGRPCAPLLLTSATTTVAVPGLPWTLNELRHERIAADVMAWTRRERLFVHLDLGDDPIDGLRRCLELFASLDP
jgi:hypothetical protein